MTSLGAAAWIGYQSFMNESAIWERFVTMEGAPEGFTVRTTYPTNPDGVVVMLERWQAGTAEPPHSHRGDDMTVVIEGKMSIQFYVRKDGALVADGAPVVLSAGQTGYVKSRQIHDAKYLEDCRLVYVHDRAFEFREEK